MNAPYLKRLRTGRPWVHAKWAMTLDGKIATRTGDSKWITGEAARARVHELRGRMDAVIVGKGTCVADDPLLTARPPGPRTADAGRANGDGRRAADVHADCWKRFKAAPVVVVQHSSRPSHSTVRRDRGAEVWNVGGRTGC